MRPITIVPCWILLLSACLATAPDAFDTAEEGIPGAALVALLSGRVAATSSVVAALAPGAINNLLLWLKADALQGLSDGQTATTWPDSSAGSYNFTATNTPLYRTAVRSGLPALSFQAGDSDYFEFPLTSALNPAEFTIAFVCAVTGAAGTIRSPLTNRGNTGPTRKGLHFYAESGNTWTGTVANSDWQALSAGTVTTGDWTILSMSQGGGERQTLFKNGDLMGTQIVPGYLVNDTNTFRIGAGENAGPADYFFEGFIAEVVYIGRVLSDTELAGLQCYLSNRYAITVPFNCGAN